MTKKIKENMTLTPIILFLVYTLCIHAPYEMYLTNKNEFWFRLNLFWWVPLVLSIGIIILLTAIGSFLKGKLEICYEAILFALGIAVYLQGNFLNLKVGVMNGEEIFWENYNSWFVADSIIWCIIFVIILVVALKKKELFSKISRYVSAFLIAIQAVALITLLVPAILSGEEKGENYRILTYGGLYDTGPDESIVIFLLDMFDDNYFREILVQEPEIAEELEGFTYFSNFTGTYSTTVCSLAHLSTGKIYRNEMVLDKWVQSVSENGGYLDVIKNNGYDMSFYVTSSSFFPDNMIESAENFVYSPLKISNYLCFTKDLYQLVMCRYFPDFMKPYIWMTGNEFIAWQEYYVENPVYTTDNFAFIEGLYKNGVEVTETNKSYKFIHLDGSHYPYIMNENLERVEEYSVTGTQCARGALKMVQLYMEQLKEKGTYDNTAIVILADHGYYTDGTLTNPIFLVKPMGATGKLDINNAPTCQADFAPTILELLGLNNEPIYGRSVFEIEEGENRDRFFYQYYLKEATNPFRLIEYKIDSQSNDRDSFHLTDVEYTINGKKIQHSKYCKTCKEDNNENTEDINPIKIIHFKDSNYPE